MSSDATAFFRWTELDRTSFPEWLGHMQAFVEAPEDWRPRSYPGLPRWRLPRRRPRWLASLDAALVRRRSAGRLGTELPRRSALGRLLAFGHGLSADGRHGPTPSAGALNALELYLVNLQEGWLPAGAYHYDRPGHHLSQLRAGAGRARWEDLVPALRLRPGGCLLWVLVGDGERVARKYAERGQRFLLLEAGHLMQSLCLLSASLGLSTVPLGGFFEGEVRRELWLPRADLVLYVGVCGRPCPV